jgi:hypothetical protein
VSLGRGGSRLRGSGAFDDITGGSGEAEKCHPRRLSRPRPFCKARVGWGLSFVPRATACYQRLWWVGFTEAPMIGL